MTTPKNDKQKWASSNKAIKAVQVAFDMDEKLQYVIRKEALDAGLGPSDQIRKILELPVTKRPKRPRLTVSLSGDDYQLLAERYGIAATEQLEIKKRVMQELTHHAGQVLE
ncbi:hypothetical protein N7931_05880 [Catenovulum sp. 2E275]|uniref:hypothetical protein n=1 Tax=Catenovulum sp. 2E275 TaxID=2980497 RepID=UPI0021CE3C7A|nr:hypothetical protein [Catenovulum sp. 2E275]MCU4675158.1 hypothetical protein [Catenovulum sp. 2E275]